jgi:hypothetical protein
MLGTGQDFPQDHLTRRLLGNPRFPNSDVKERRAGQPHGSQQIRQYVSRHSASAGHLGV